MSIAFSPYFLIEGPYVYFIKNLFKMTKTNDKVNISTQITPQ